MLLVCSIHEVRGISDILISNYPRLNSSLVPSTGSIIKIPGTGNGDTIPPAQVTGLTVTSISSTRLDLAWAKNGSADLNHYNIYRGNTSGFAVILGTTKPIATPTINSYSNTGLNSATTYYYRISAVDNASNIGTTSSQVSGKTKPPVQVTGLTAIASTTAYAINLLECKSRAKYRSL